MTRISRYGWSTFYTHIISPFLQFDTLYSHLFGYCHVKLVDDDGEIENLHLMFHCMLMLAEYMYSVREEELHVEWVLVKEKRRTHMTRFVNFA